MVDRALNLVTWYRSQRFLVFCSQAVTSHISLPLPRIDSIFFPGTISRCEQLSLQILDLPAKRAPCFGANCVNRARAGGPSRGAWAARMRHLSRRNSRRLLSRSAPDPNTILVHPLPLCTLVGRSLPYLRFKQKRKSTSRHTLDTAVTFLSLEGFPFVRNARSLTCAAISFARNRTPSGTGQRFTVKVTKMEFNRKRGVLTPILSLALWMGTTTGALADESSDIEEIVVQASLVHDTTDEGMTTVHLINKDQIKSMPVLSLGSSLEGLLGVNVSDYGSGVGQPVIRGMSGSRVRVLENGSIVRDVSGLGADHMNDIDIANAQQIEVIRGPASLLYSNGTMGGIINVVDRSIAQSDLESTQLSIGAETQSVNDGESASLSASTHAAGLNWSYSGSYSNLNNYDVPTGALEHDEHHDEEEHEEEHGEEEHEDEEHDLGSLSNSDTARTTHKLGLSKTGDWGYVGASFSRRESVFGIPVHADEHGGHGDEEHDDDEEHGDEEHGEDDHDDEHGHGEHGEDERIFAETKSDIWKIEGRINEVGSFINSIDFSYQDSDYSHVEQHAEGEEHEGEEHDDEEHGEHEHEGPTLFTNEAQEFEIRLNLDSESSSHRVVSNLSKEMVAIVGEEAFMRPTESREMTVGYFFSREWSNGFHVDFGARFDNLDREGSVAHMDEDHHDEDHDDEDHDDEDHDDHEGEVEIDQFDLNFKTTSFALGLTQAFDNDVSLSLGLSSIERAPSAVEMFINGPHLAAQRFEIGDPAMTSERGFNSEISLSVDRPNFFLNLTLFNNEVSDYIYLRDETEEEHEDEEHGEHDHGSLILAEYEQEDASFSGYEFEIGTTFDFDMGQLTLTYSRDQTNASLDSGPRVPRLAPARDTLSVDGSISGFDTRLSYQRVSDQSKVAPGEEPTDGYDMLNLSITRTFALGASELDVTVFGRNLLDEVARRHTSFVKEEAPLPGRNLGVKLYYRL